MSLVCLYPGYPKQQQYQDQRNITKQRVSFFGQVLYPPASEASREVANLTERKNLHIPVYGVKEFFRLSVCDPNYLKCC